MEFIVWLLVGAIAGWLAGQLVRGYGFGLIGNIVVGVVGAFVSGLLFKSYLKIGLIKGFPIIDQIIFGTVGAVILLLVIRLVRGR